MALWPSAAASTRLRAATRGPSPCLRLCASSMMTRSNSGSAAFSACPKRSFSTSGAARRSKRSGGTQGSSARSRSRNPPRLTASCPSAKLKLDMRRKKSRSGSSVVSRTRSTSRSQWTSGRAGVPTGVRTRRSETRTLCFTKSCSSFCHLRWMFARGAMTSTRAFGLKCRSSATTPSATYVFPMPTSSARYATPWLSRMLCSATAPSSWSAARGALPISTSKSSSRSAVRTSSLTRAAPRAVGTAARASRGIASSRRRRRRARCAGCLGGRAHPRARRCRASRARTPGAPA